MSISDSIADMLTKVRNASSARHEKVDVPASKMKIEIVKIFKNEGYIKNFKLLEDKKTGFGSHLSEVRSGSNQNAGDSGYHAYFEARPS